jgi:hypothetical protein
MDIQTTLGVPLAKLITNFQTLGAVATHTQTVPATKRWLLLDGSIERDNAATLQINITDAADQIFIHSNTEAAGTTRVSLASLFSSMPILLDAGHKIVLTWGVAQTTPEISLVVLEIDV